MARSILEVIECTRCDGTGFLNIHQVPKSVIDEAYLADYGRDVAIILKWAIAATGHDVRMCDCCSDGEGWYGVPGGHYTEDDPAGNDGPYQYNGGLCECH